jgi:hypothetical protein
MVLKLNSKSKVNSDKLGQQNLCGGW